ncbi:Shootin-1 [Orchesella cincta]|uniref:Shootin-1 n=1 Tax=Orchesella cincta TaxID=48709 RepID=A0A1D2MQA0_ORCCI|nr:Shootin-1 [Orchesella cincta]
MSSVRNRILQFQQSTSDTTGNGSVQTCLKSSFGRNGSVPPDIVATTGPTVSRNQFALSNSSLNNNSISSSTTLGRASKTTASSACPTFPYISSTQQNHSSSTTTTNNASSGHTNGYFGNTYGLKTASNTSSSTTTATTTAANSSQVNSRKYSGTFTDSNNTLASTWKSAGSSGGGSSNSILEPNGGSRIIRTVEVPLKSRKSEESFNLNPTPPAVNRANKPTLAMKKASMTINLTSTAASSTSNSPSPPGSSNGINSILSSMNGSSSSSRALPSPTRSKARTTPTRTNPLSSIPKLNSSNSNGMGFGISAAPASSVPTTVRYRDPSPGGIGRRSPATNSNRTTPATTPTSNGVAFGSSVSSSTGRFYQSIGWKEKFEESEKKKNHLVSLAQKATRDYEELRRRYHDLYTDHEKLVTRCEAAQGQLESLRKASEATYDEYYKLKRRYESENREKSDALSRVDEYNKENRRLKRQSAMMMQQIDPSTLLANGNLFDSVSEAESPESDKEIQYLRKHVKELEEKIIELEAELERIRLSEFESQESVLLMNDTIQSSTSESTQLRDQLRKLDEENRKLARSLEDLTLEHDSLKAKHSVDEEKVLVAEAELKKLLNEKNILQRQSLVFMGSEEMDNRLLGALNQIGDVQNSMEDQKNALESQIIELKNRLSEKELEEETAEIQHSAQLKALEEEIQSLRRRAEEAERKLEDCSFQSAPPPPPPPPPMGLGAPPPPPPPPMMSGPTLGNGGLGTSLQAAMCTLRKPRIQLECDTPPNGSSDQKSLVSATPQIDDIITQLKQGIKLRPTDKTLSRKNTEHHDKSAESNAAVEEMKSILDNMRRVRVVEKRF